MSPKVSEAPLGLRPSTLPWLLVTCLSRRLTRTDRVASNTLGRYGRGAMQERPLVDSEAESMQQGEWRHELGGSHQAIHLGGAVQAEEGARHRGSLESGWIAE